MVVLFPTAICAVLTRVSFIAIRFYRNTSITGEDKHKNRLPSFGFVALNVNNFYRRVEPGVHFYCDLDYDPFLFMQKNNKMYSFTVALQEIPETIPTLWEHTLRFAHKNGLKTKLLRMFGDESGYNLCHFWSNFEIASLQLWRDERYQVRQTIPSGRDTRHKKSLGI